MAGILGKIFSGGAKQLVDSVGNAIDKIHTSAEEKELIKHEVNKAIYDFEKTIQQQVSERWKADMQSTNWLAKSIRPLSLAFLLIVLSVFTIIDFGYVELDIKDSWIDLWQMLAITAFGAYFGGRSYEKIKK
jgi:cation transport ATPase